MTNYIGNISTIIKTISMILAGWVIGTLAANGLDLGVDEETLSQIIGSIIFFILAYIDAKFHNTITFQNILSFLGKTNNPNKTLDIPKGEVILNDEYETKTDSEEEDEDGT